MFFFQLNPKAIKQDVNIPTLKRLIELKTQITKLNYKNHDLSDEECDNYMNLMFNFEDLIKNLEPFYIKKKNWKDPEISILKEETKAYLL